MDSAFSAFTFQSGYIQILPWVAVNRDVSSFTFQSGYIQIVTVA